MNLRQKYKKAKRELEFYKKHGQPIRENYVVVKKHDMPIKTLTAQQICGYPGSNCDQWVEEYIRVALSKEARKYVKIERECHSGSCVLMRGTLNVLDICDDERVYLGRRIDVGVIDDTVPDSLKRQITISPEEARARYFQEPVYKSDTDEERSSFTKEQLWPAVNPYLTREENDYD